MNQMATIHINNEYLKFSVAHFTVFSSTHRERLHGHNFQLSARLTAPVDNNGLSFDYSLFKQVLNGLCQELDEYTVIPSESPYLTIQDLDPYYHVTFSDETMILLKSDTLLLPIKNATVEEFSHYILQRLISDWGAIKDYDIEMIEVSVASGPGQKGSSNWTSEA